jgi:hypothetical protein
LRKQHKTIYLAEKARYEAIIKREKIQSWKEYCNLTSSNSWNKVYKLAAGKRRYNTQITTVQKPGGSLTEDLRETLQLMLELFTPDDNEEYDTELHKLARAQALDPADTDDHIDFTVEKNKNAVASMDKNKAPSEDGITGEVYKCLRGLPQIYNCHVQRLPAKRSLPNEMENCKADTHCETRKRKQRRGLQIPPHKSSQHRKQRAKETAYK